MRGYLGLLCPLVCTSDKFSAKENLFAGQVKKLLTSSMFHPNSVRMETAKFLGNMDLHANSSSLLSIG
jgi:uncharacterized protein YwbE